MYIYGEKKVFRAVEGSTVHSENIRIKEVGE